MVEKLFKLESHHTTFRTEILAGLTTFAAMSYILAVNPAILSETGLGVAGLITVTALAAAAGSLFMAVLTNYPIALAPGMGLNAYFAYNVVIANQIPVQAALGFVFWNGVLFLVLSVTGIRTRIALAIPHSMRIGVQCGIGLFIAFIGLRNGGIIVNNDATLVAIGDLSRPSVLLCLVGILLMVYLVTKRVPGAIFVGILILTLVGLFLPKGSGNVTAAPGGIVGLPAPIDETFFRLDIFYVFEHFNQAFPIILALLFVDMFDTIGTLVGVSRRAELLNDHGNLPKMGNALTADAAATVTGSLLGTSTVTAYVESAAGVESGGRTGLTAVTVAACFLLALFFWPIIQVIPFEATAPALVLVGIFMLHGVSQLDFDDLTELAPAFITMLTMPLTYSISEGIGLGFISFVGIKLLTGRRRDVSVLTAALAVVFLLHYVL